LGLSFIFALSLLHTYVYSRTLLLTIEARAFGETDVFQVKGNGENKDIYEHGYLGCPRD
jgi:hypothetical protein